MKHPKLTIPQQIENMKRKGITFNICSEAEARKFLEVNNYYYKLKAYSKNYDMYRSGEKQGQYINLDFAYLKDLSTIDARLRKLILNMTIDLEHFLKVSMLAHFNAVDEDGYDIIDDLFKTHPSYQDEIEAKHNTSTCSNIVKKYNDHWAIWSIIELMSFGQFIELYRLFYNRNYTSYKNKNCELLFPIKMIRNAAAHNNCLINQLRPPFSREINPTYEIRERIAQLTSFSRDKIKKRLQHPTIHDFSALLLLYNDIVPEPTRTKSMTEVKELFTQRIPRNKDYYKKEQVICTNYEFITEIIFALCNNISVDK